MQVTTSLGEKLPGITFDSELKSAENISKVSNIVNKNSCALYRITNHVNLDKDKMILKAFIESNFSYYSPIWMFH